MEPIVCTFGVAWTVVLIMSGVIFTLAWQAWDMRKIIAAQQTQIDDLKRELEEVKGKMEK